MIITRTPEGRRFQSVPTTRRPTTTIPTAAAKKILTATMTAARPWCGNDAVVVPRVGGKPVSLVGSDAAAAARNTRSTHTHTRTEIPGSPGRITWLPTGEHHRRRGPSS